MQAGRSSALSVLFAVLLMGAALARSSAALFGKFVNANLPNPDSYYNLVALADSWAKGHFPFMARDNAPYGVWMHWTMPYSWTVWQVHCPFTWLGFGEKHALLYAGGAVTLISTLLVVFFVALAVLRAGTRRAAMVSGLVLATSVGFQGYARIDQITNNIFFLVPLAAAAACLLGNSRRRRVGIDVVGGCLLGLALWITPETMPFIVGLVWLRAAIRAQYPDSGALWPMVAGLIGITLTACWIDPPPPTYNIWTLDRISLAWVWFAALLGCFALAVDWMVSRRLPLSAIIAAGAVVFGVIAAIWLFTTPDVLNGARGLVPPTLQSVWWDQLVDQHPSHWFPDWITELTMPIAATAVTGYYAWRRRSLWFAGLAFLALAYGALAVWHPRMDAAAALASALAFGIGVAQFQAFANSEQHLQWRQQTSAFFFTTLPVLLLFATAALAWQFPRTGTRINCPLAPVAAALNRIPPTTILTGVFSGPELLYRTHHRIVAGPYHHNIAGMSDAYALWLNTNNAIIPVILKRRGIRYVLGCKSIGQNLAHRSRPTLSARVISGDVPAWLRPVPWSVGTHTKWHLYEVVRKKSNGAAARKTNQQLKTP